MKIIILAAGFATRLRPLTEKVPKALLPIGGKPILNHILDPLLPALVSPEIALITNSVYVEPFNNWQKDIYPTLGIQIIDNGVVDIDSRLGAIGDLAYTLKHTGWDDDLLVLASDTLTSLNWPQFMEFVESHKDNPATVVCPTDDISIISNKLGCAVVESDKLISFIEKPENPPSNLRAVPFYYFPQSSLALIENYYNLGQNLDSPGSIIPYLLKHTPIFAFDLGSSGYYHDVGTIDVYNALFNDPSKLL